MRWRAHYDPGVPHSLAPYPDKTLLDVFAETVRERPAHPVLFFKGHPLAAHALDRLSDSFAAALVALGVKKGDRVGVVLPNCPQFLIVELGTWKAGGVLVPLNPIYGDEELAKPLRASGVETVVVLTRFYARLKGIQARTSVRRVIATRIKEYLPAPLRLLFTLLKERKEGHRVRLEKGDLWLQDLLARHARDSRPAVDVRPEDPAFILLSGGTTGTPKGVVAPHRSLSIAALQSRAWYGPHLAEGVDRVLLP
ncbi:MAG TPA: AMP-binding protein, partial [Vicinamibacteria bacterium]